MQLSSSLAFPPPDEAPLLGLDEATRPPILLTLHVNANVLLPVDAAEPRVGVFASWFYPHPLAPRHKPTFWPQTVQLRGDAGHSHSLKEDY